MVVATGFLTKMMDRRYKIENREEVVRSVTRRHYRVLKDVILRGNSFYRFRQKMEESRLIKKTLDK